MKEKIIKFLKIVLFLFILVPLLVFLSFSVLILHGLIIIFFISVITGSSFDNFFAIIVGIIVSALFYFKTSLGKRIIIDYLMPLSDKFANFVE